MLIAVVSYYTGLHMDWASEAKVHCLLIGTRHHSEDRESREGSWPPAI